MPERVVRLKKRANFLHVSSVRNSKAKQGFIIQIAEREFFANDFFCELLPSRVGFTVSRKVGNAVIRNRVKRRLRSLADKIIPEVTPFGIDYVVIGRKEAFSLPFSEMEKDFKNAVTNLVKNLRKL